FITRDTNYSISDKDPSIYLPQVKDEYPNALKKQFIPEDSSLWTAEKYQEFLQKRREWIAKEINDFLNSLKNHEADVDVKEIDITKNTWLDTINNGENNFTEFKSTMRYCLREKKPMPYIEHGILKTINAFLNSEGGTLIIGVEDNGNILGLDMDYATFGNKGKDGFLLHFDNIIIKSLGKEQQNDIDIKFEKVDNKEIAIIEVRTSNKPVFLSSNGDKTFYVRHAASSRQYDISEAYEYINKHWN